MAAKKTAKNSPIYLWLIRDSGEPYVEISDGEYPGDVNAEESYDEYDEPEVQHKLCICEEVVPDIERMLGVKFPRNSTAEVRLKIEVAEYYRYSRGGDWREEKVLVKAER